MRVVFSGEMLKIEKEAESLYGLTTSELMERAGGAVAEEATRMTLLKSNVLIVCGKGNNGGDGFVAARLLKARGYKVKVICLAQVDELASQAREAFDRLPSDIELLMGYESERFDEALDKTNLVIDAIFGFSLKGPVRGVALDAIDHINAAKKKVLSVDLPSGLEADTGRVYDHTVEAAATVTFTAPKVGMVLHPGTEYIGELIVADIGIPAEIIDVNSEIRVLESDEIMPHIPVRTFEVHKKSVGQVLIVAGSRGMSGAAILAARGAFRAGAGMVAFAAPDSIVSTLNAGITEAIVYSQAETETGTLSPIAYEAILELALNFDVILLGPGLSTNPETIKLARRLIADIDNPMVIDADGLNALAGHTDLLTERLSQTVITPHPGEMARLYGVTTRDVVNDWIGYARRAMNDFDAVTVLKGSRTIISGIDETTINTTGNPGLATAGTGDVLAGMIAAFMAQRVNRYEAASVAAYLHGMAADIAVTEMNENSLMASDVVDYISDAIKYVIG
jgi:ADP-dependent NAD(P)H-hydrate dehydratase / NAD(P)H-hydrate epimerase